MKIEARAPGALKPHPRNSRRHPRSQIDMLARSITAAWGFVQPIVVDEENTILIGHARALAAVAAGLTEVPVVVKAGLSEAEKRALIIADNRLHESGGGWNRKLRDAELRHLVSVDFDITLTGFDLAETSPRETIEEDDVPEPAGDSVAVSHPGDIWALGRHRLACGSSTDAATVAALLAGEKPDLMVTDPPYGVEYDAEWRNKVVRHDGTAVAARATGKVLNDDQADWRDAWALFPGAVAYVWHAGVYAPVVQRSLEAAGLEFREQIVWLKNRAAISRGAYHWQHEPCFFAVRGKSDRWRGGRGRSSVWEVSHTRNATGHSTQKPVEVMRRPMLCHTGIGDAVYEPFMGSGTSLIAAETCGRTSLGIELDPDYVDLAVRRWQAFTGEEATLAATGQGYEEVCAERAS